MHTVINFRHQNTHLTKILKVKCHQNVIALLFTVILYGRPI